MKRTLLFALLVTLAAPAVAQDSPPAADQEPTVRAVAAEAADAPAAAAPETSDEPAGETANEGEELAAEPAETFDPTEEVDEDYSIPFPTDI